MRTHLLANEDRRSAAVLLLAVALVFAGLESWRPGYFLWDDNATSNLPNFTLSWDALAHEGKPAEINYHQYLGVPHLASGFTGALYPGAFLAVPLSQLALGDARWAIDLSVLLHLLVAALGMQSLLRSWQLSSRIALWGAGSWVTFPFVVQVSKSWVFVAFVAAVTPWVVLFVDRLLESPDLRATWLLAIAHAILLYQGHLQFAFLALAATAVYAATASGLRFGLGALRGLLRAAVALAAGALLAAPLLLPAMAAKAVSAQRAGGLPYDELVSNALDPWVATAAQVFVMKRQAVHLATGAIYYLGLPVIILAAASVFGRSAKAAFRDPNRARSVAALAAAATSLLLSTRSWGVVYGVPGLGSFRWPFKAYLFVLFFATLAAALGAERLRYRPERWIRRSTGSLLVAAIAGNLVILFTPSLDRSFGVNRLEQNVTRLRADTARRFDVDSGRVVSLWLEPEEPRIERFLAFQFATLARAYHLGGYDPLVPALNWRLAKGLEFSNIFRYELNHEALEYLASWSVRTYLVPEDPGRERFLARLAPRLVRRGSDDGVAIWEDTQALPFASFEDSIRDPVAVTWLANGIQLSPAGRSGRLLLRVAPLPGYVVEVDGVPSGSPHTTPGGSIALDVPAGSQRIVLRHDDVPLRLGVAIAGSVALSALVISWLRRRRFDRRAPESRETPAIRP